MTQEEARLTLQDNFGYLSQEHPRILEALRVALDALSQLSLPSALDEAAEKYLDGIFGKGKHVDSYIQLFKAGAEWGMNQRPLPEDATIFLKGVAEGKRLMMEEAVNGRVYRINGNNVIEKLIVSQKFQDGDKVRVIVIKEDWYE